MVTSCETYSFQFIYCRGTLPVVKYVIMDIERCGLFVEVLITDNHPLNVLLFKLFSSDKNTRKTLLWFHIQLVQTKNYVFCLILYTFSN